MKFNNFYIFDNFCSCFRVVSDKYNINLSTALPRFTKGETYSTTLDRFALSLLRNNNVYDTNKLTLDLKSVSSIIRSLWRLQKRRRTLRPMLMFKLKSSQLDNYRSAFERCGVYIFFYGFRWVIRVNDTYDSSII